MKSVYMREEDSSLTDGFSGRCLLGLRKKIADLKRAITGDRFLADVIIRQRKVFRDDNIPDGQETTML